MILLSKFLQSGSEVSDEMSKQPQGKVSVFVEQWLYSGDGIDDSIVLIPFNKYPNKNSYYWLDK